MKRPLLIVLALAAPIFFLVNAIRPGDEANAACNQWDISGNWGLRQTNGALVSVEIQQDGQNLRGSAKTYNFDRDPSTIHGDLDGSIKGNDLELTIYWVDDAVGVYKGSINERGRMEGSTYDRMNPKSTAL